MVVELFHDQSPPKNVCRTWGSNPRPAAYQADARPTELPRPGLSFINLLFRFLDLSLCYSVIWHFVMWVFHYIMSICYFVMWIYLFVMSICHFVMWVYHYVMSIFQFIMWVSFCHYVKSVLHYVLWLYHCIMAICFYFISVRHSVRFVILLC